MPVELRSPNPRSVADFVDVKVGEMAYGGRMGFLAKGVDVNGFRKNLKESIRMLIPMGYLPTLNYITKSRWLNRYIGPSTKDKRGYGHLIAVI